MGSEELPVGGEPERGRWRMAAAAAVLAVIASVVAPVGAADAASDRGPHAPPARPANIAPGLAEHPDYTRSSEPRCRRGLIVCVDALIREMQRNYDRLGCDHNAVFALLYLRTTEAIRDGIVNGVPVPADAIDELRELGIEVVDDAGHPTAYFSDPHFLAHEAYVFGRYYLDPLYDWERGRLDRIPEPWLIAFETAAEEAVSVAGNMWLGINAHVNHDLPLVLAAIGVEGPDGASREGDHVLVNHVLANVGPVSRGAIDTHLAPMPDFGVAPETWHPAAWSWLPFPDGDTAPLDAVPRWRATAWDHALGLVGDASGQPDVVGHATDLAQAIAEQTTVPAGSDAVVAMRNAYCAQHRWSEGDRVPGYAQG
jgi:hypothetical protein